MGSVRFRWFLIGGDGIELGIEGGVSDVFVFDFHDLPVVEEIGVLHDLFLLGFRTINLVEDEL